MTNPVEAISALLALEFVVMAGLVLVLVPLDVAAPLIPLMVVITVALQLYRS